MFKVSKRLPKQCMGLLLAGSLAACVGSDSVQTENGDVPSLVNFR